MTAFHRTAPRAVACEQHIGCVLAHNLCVVRSQQREHHNNNSNNNRKEMK